MFKSMGFPTHTSVKDTSIELKIKEFLEKLNIKFEQHKYLPEIRHAYQCDFFLPIQEEINKITIIECDGCYWHGCPICFKENDKRQRKQIAKDNRRKKELKGQGYKVIRLCEHDIKEMTIENLKSIL